MRRSFARLACALALLSAASSAAAQNFSRSAPFAVQAESIERRTLNGTWGLIFLTPNRQFTIQEGPDGSLTGSQNGERCQGFYRDFRMLLVCDVSPSNDVVLILSGEMVSRPIINLPRLGARGVTAAGQDEIVGKYCIVNLAHAFNCLPDADFRSVRLS